MATVFRLTLPQLPSQGSKVQEKINNVFTKLLKSANRRTAGLIVDIARSLYRNVTRLRYIWSRARFTNGGDSYAR
jgi:hypothetical protein